MTLSDYLHDGVRWVYECDPAICGPCPHDCGCLRPYVHPYVAHKSPPATWRPTPSYLLILTYTFTFHKDYLSSHTLFGLPTPSGLKFKNKYFIEELLGLPWRSQRNGLPLTALYRMQKAVPKPTQTVHLTTQKSVVIRAIVSLQVSMDALTICPRLGAIARKWPKAWTSRGVVEVRAPWKISRTNFPSSNGFQNTGEWLLSFLCFIISPFFLLFQKIVWIQKIM